MIARAFLAALHVLALPLGFTALFLRGMRLRELRRSPDDAAARVALLRADNVWGVAAILWIVTGLTRVFGELEKTTDFYLRNGFFWVKMSLFLLVFVLEIAPMVTFMTWRIARDRAVDRVALAPLDRFVTLNDAELVLVLLIPFAAALMARGAWMF